MFNAAAPLKGLLIKLIFDVLLILILSYSGENVSYDTLPL